MHNVSDMKDDLTEDRVLDRWGLTDGHRSCRLYVLMTQQATAVASLKPATLRPTAMDGSSGGVNYQELLDDMSAEAQRLGP